MRKDPPGAGKARPPGDREGGGRTAASRETCRNARYAESDLRGHEGLTGCHTCSGHACSGTVFRSFSRAEKDFLHARDHFPQGERMKTQINLSTDPYDLMRFSSRAELLDLLETDGLDYSLYADYTWYVAYARGHLQP